MNRNRFYPAALLICVLFFFASCASNNHIQFVRVKDHIDGSSKKEFAKKDNANTAPQAFISHAQQKLSAITTTSAQKISVPKNNLAEKKNKAPLHFSGATIQSGMSSVQTIPSYLVNLKSGNGTSTDNDSVLLYVIIAILLPWLGVLLFENGITNHFWIDLILWLLFYIPGLIYALYIILG